MQLLTSVQQPTDVKFSLISTAKKAMLIFLIEEFVRVFPAFKTLLILFVKKVKRRIQSCSTVDFRFDMNSSQVQFGRGILHHVSNTLQKTSYFKFNIIQVQSMFLPDLGQKFEFQPDVFLRGAPVKETEHEKYYFEISSYNKSQNELITLAQKFDDEFDIKQQSLLCSLHFFEPLVLEKDHRRMFTEVSLVPIPFHSTKSFENVFVPFSKDIKSRLDFFLNNKNYYEQIGIPYTYGMLFHGKPGCGKTSMIKAIANYTNRHIINIRLQSIPNASILRKLFNEPTITIMTSSDSYYSVTSSSKLMLPNDKRLYVIEDIDAMSSITESREEKEEKEDAKPDNSRKQELTLNIPSLVGTHAHVSNIKETPLTLQDLLEAFDGLLEMDGRLMIITTNRLHVLDDALIRPGRCDSIFYFEESTIQIIRDIFRTFFGTEMSEDIMLQDGKVTPAQLMQICFKYQNCPKEAEIHIEKLFLHT